MVHEAMLRPFASDAAAMGSDPALIASVGESIFAIAGGMEVAFVEKDGLASLRLAASGNTREVVMAPLDVLWDFVAQHGGSAPLRVPLDDILSGGSAPQTQEALKGLQAQLATGLLHMSVALIQELGPALHRATLAPGDMLYVPAGWLVAESVTPDTSAFNDAPG